MNERIKELMDEAVEFRLDPDSNHYEAQVSPEELEVFAELIVRECVLEIKMTMVRDGYDTKHYLQSRKHIDRICKHFGVEE